MLVIPTKGFGREVQLDIFCDWIEGSIVFDEEELSQIDIVDVLLEEEIYNNQDSAHQMVTNAWIELQNRSRWIGNGCVFIIDNQWLRRKAQWKETPAHIFCILSSLASSYDWWISEFGRDYTEQGELFEQLTKESLEAQFGSNWIIYQTGWTRTNTVRLKEVVNEVIVRLGENPGDIELWDHSNAKEMGLDLLCYKPFPDKRIGIPVYLMQCASGGNWKSKLYTPDLNVWNDLVRFRNQPVKAFSTPFSFLDEQFKQNCVFVKGLLMDRCRLLCASRYNQDWVSETLKGRIIAWADPRVKVLLERSK